MNLTITNLAFERNFRCLLNNINFTLTPGELMQIRGTNGSGKSTLLRILAGFIEPTRGTIQWQDKNVALDRDHYQQQIHYVGHQNGIKPYLTVRENLQLNYALANHPKNVEQLEYVLQQFGLQHLTQTQALHLSAGQARRIALARLLLHTTPLWILDEPTTALDEATQIFLTTLLQQHLSAGGIAIVATHHDLPQIQPHQLLQLGSAS